MLKLTIRHELQLATTVNILMVLLLLPWANEPSLILMGLRLIVGLIFLLFMPGFLLQSVLFWRNRELNALEQIALSMGISAALAGALALLLDVMHWGLQLEAIVSAIILLTTLLALIGGLRRRNSEKAFLVISLFVLPWWQEQDNMNRLLYGVMALALLGAAFFSAAIITLPRPGDSYTSFYLLGSEHLAEAYPQDIVLGETVTVMAGITNQEGHASKYYVKMLHVGKVIGQLEAFTLNDGETLETLLEFTPENTGNDLEIDIILYRDDVPQPYRTLRLWLNVSAESVELSEYLCCG